MPKARIASFISLALLVFVAAAVHAQDVGVDLRFENHRFQPQTLTVPSGRPLIINVINASRETIEFESFKLNREKVVEPGETVKVHLPGLRPGRYDFYDDFHQDVPEGTIVAK
jgi:hypothetical protein